MNKTKQLNIRISPIDYENIIKLTKLTNQSQSKVIRQAIHNSLIQELDS